MDEDELTKELRRIDEKVNMFGRVEDNGMLGGARDEFGVLVEDIAMNYEQEVANNFDYEAMTQTDLNRVNSGPGFSEESVLDQINSKAIRKSSQAGMRPQIRPQTGHASHKRMYPTSNFAHS